MRAGRHMKPSSSPLSKRCLPHLLLSLAFLLSAVSASSSVPPTSSVVQSPPTDSTAISIQGSAVVGSGDVSLAAGGDVSVTTAQETYNEEHEQNKRRTGVSTSFGKGGFGVTYGTTKEHGTNDVDVVSNIGSTVGSVSGSVSIAADKDATITGSEVLSVTGTDITGRSVTIDSAYNTVDTRSLFESKSYGVNLQVGNKVVESAAKAHEAEERSDKVQDDRLKALYAYQAGRALYDGYQAGQGLYDAVAAGKAAQAVQVSIGVSTSKSKSESESHSITAVGSRLVTDGLLSITATGEGGTGGDLTIIGSALEGGNVTLDAARDILLLSAQNTTDSRSRSRSSSGGAGVGIGVDTQGHAGLSVQANAAGSNGNMDAHSLTHTETLITAKENLSITSGRDTTLRGAQARAETIVANVGRDLSLESEQDSETYRAENKNTSGGASVTVIGTPGGSGNFSYMQGKTTSEYYSVVEQTGLFAGSGGFDITVGKNTDLKGAVIASAAPADKNRLSTESLSWSDIENRAEYQASTTGASAGYDSSKPGFGPMGASVTPIVGVSSSDDANSKTLAAISPATIEIRGNKDQDISTLSRDPDAAHQALGKIFDQKKVEEQQELARVFGEEAFRLVGDVSKEMGWKDGSFEKIALHGIIAAVQANFGGGNTAIGGLAGMTNEALIPIIAEQLEKNGVLPNTELYHSLMKLSSTIVGGAVGALAGGGSSNVQTGGAVALAATTHNFLGHLDYEELKRLRAKGKDRTPEENERLAILEVANQASDGLLEKARQGEPLTEYERQNLQIFLDAYYQQEGEAATNRLWQTGISPTKDYAYPYAGSHQMKVDWVSSNPLTWQEAWFGRDKSDNEKQFNAAMRDANLYPALPTPDYTASLLPTALAARSDATLFGSVVNSSLAAGWYGISTVLDIGTEEQRRAGASVMSNLSDIGTSVMLYKAGLGPAFGTTPEAIIQRGATSQIGMAEPQTSLVPYDPKFAATQLLQKGTIPESNLQLLVRQSSPNEFIPSNTIADGFKYTYTDINMQVKWHSQDLNANLLYPGSNSGSGWTTQIKVGNELLGQDGIFYNTQQLRNTLPRYEFDRIMNMTHIPVK